MPQCPCHLRADEAMTLEFQGTMVLGRQSMKLQSSRMVANTNPVPAPTRRASTSGTGPPPKLFATYSYSSFAPSSLHSSHTMLPLHADTASPSILTTADCEAETRSATLIAAALAHTRRNCGLMH